MKDFKFCLLFVALTMIYCCTNDVKSDTHELINNTMNFTGSLENAVLTRKLDSTWQKGDKIGLYAFESGKNQSQSTVDEDVYNREMITNDGYVFVTTPDTESLEYPKAGESKDFVAYFPYNSNQLLEDFTYPVRLDNQKNIDAIDLLYSNNLKGVSNVPSKLELKFKHQLARVTLVFKSKSYDLKGAKVTALNIPTQADFNLISGKFLINKQSNQNVVAQSTYDGSAMTSNLLLLPDASLGQVVFLIELTNGEEFSFSTPVKWTWDSGKNYTKDLNLNAKGETTDPEEPENPDPKPVPTVAYMEYPKIDKLTSNQVVLMHMDPSNPKQRNYSMLYDKKLKFATWVAYPHHSYYLGSTKRTNAWQYDPKVDRRDQANLTKGYPNNQGLDIDRGHQIPSGDRTKDRAINATTFYFTNMTPQKGKNLNQKVWADLEGKVRDWTTSHRDTIYVVTGAGIYDMNNISYVKDNSNDMVAKPDYYYKTLLKKVNGKYETIGYFFENKDTERNYDKFRKPVSEIEKITGYTFYPGLPDPAVKNKINNSVW